MKPADFDASNYSVVDIFEHDDHTESEVYHESTKLNHENIRTLGVRVGQIVGDPHIVQMMTRAWKTYSGAERIQLPRGDLGSMTIQEAFEQRRSISSGGGSYSGEAISLQQLASVLAYSYGVTHSLNDPKNPEEKRQLLRATASAGGLYPLEIYPVVLNVDGLDAGIYHYNVANHELDVLRKGDFREPFLRAITYYDLCSNAAVVIVISAVLKRTLSKYLMRGYRFLLNDVGALLQSLYLAGTALKLATCAIGGFFDDEVGRVIGTNNVDEQIMMCFALGHEKR